METARRQGAARMDVGTSEDDVAARALYESAGFTNREGGPDRPMMLFYERDLWASPQRPEGQSRAPLDRASPLIENGSPAIGVERRCDMESAKAEYVVDRVNAEAYEPEIIDGTQVGEVHQIEPTGTRPQARREPLAL